MRYDFSSQKDVVRLTKKHRLSFAALCLKREKEAHDQSAAEIRQKLKETLKVMHSSVQNGLKERTVVHEMVGQNASKLNRYLKEKGAQNLTNSKTTLKAALYAIANNENNARMGVVAACPTAGSSGIVPGVFFAAKEKYKFKEKTLIDGLLVAAGIGLIVQRRATLAGAEGGCQAEIGSAIAMAAAGLTYMRGGSLSQCFEASALGLKNVLGLACDPIAGLVAVPCVKRNAVGAGITLLVSDLAIMGIKSYVPFDEVVSALKEIGDLMPAELKETALGGLAQTKTGKKAKKC